jgi:phosphatidylglycerophosphate synthase/GTP:adenosylcobinamide-phosphate guanylyltransferase
LAEADPPKSASLSTEPAVCQAVVISANGMGNPLRVVGGITLLERLLRQLSELSAVESVLILKSSDLSLPSPSNHVRKTVRCQHAEGTDAWEMLRDARTHLDERFIVVAADLVIDQRLLEWLTTQSEDVALSPRGDELDETAALLHLRCLDAPSLEAARISVVAADSMPTYWEAMHGEVPIHLRSIKTARDADEACGILLDYVQRRTLELPAQYFDPFFENPLIRCLAPTAITANQVTFATTLLGFAVAALYYTGWLRFGVLLAILVEILDGVDGKLARITRTTSKVGEYEHILDFFYENSWWLALGQFLSAKGSPFAWIGALLLVAFDLADNIVYSIADVKWGRSVDNASPFLSRFRAVAGRRNIYSWMLLPGILVGRPLPFFYAVVVWSGATATIHVTWAIAQALRSASRPAQELSGP